MNINRIDSTIPLNNIKAINQIKPKTQDDSNFSDFLKKAIYDVSDAKQYEKQLTEQLMAGKLENLHDLSIAKGIASVKMTALTETISKITDAYREITRIQI